MIDIKDLPGGKSAIRERLRPASLCALVVATSACAHARGGQAALLETQTVRAGEAVFHLQYWPEDAVTALQVKAVLERAVSAAERWGRLSAPVLVTIHPTHRALEAATHRKGYPWLRAWARYASVDLQSPRTWSRGTASDAEVAQLLAHELTHCVMYQSAASERTWPSMGIPLWFREGMASVTAGQEHELARPEAIWRFYQEQRTAGAQSSGDPLAQPEPLYRSESELVYGTAHQAFRFLIDRYGEERVRRLVARMGGGSSFQEAFQQAVGIPLQDFEGDFRRYVVWQGWRGPGERRALAALTAERRLARAPGPGDVAGDGP